MPPSCLQDVYKRQEFVRLLMPAYFISVAFAGGSASAAAFYEIALGAAWAVQWLCRRVFLSFVRVYGLLILGDHMMEEPCFSKLTDLDVYKRQDVFSESFMHLGEHQ